MNSGKSTAVLQVAYNYEERGMRTVLLKPAIDTKGSNAIIARLGTKRKVDILSTPTTNIYKRLIELNKSKKIDCVLADEAQFFTEKQIEDLFKIAVEANIPVICYGIRTDFKTKLFPGSRRLMELAHSLEELKTICRCGKKAIFNGRKINDKFVFKGEQVAIDGKNQVDYESLCGSCYLKFKAL
jgi:thymidine kinase